MKTRIGFTLLIFLVLLGTGLGRGQQQEYNGFWWVGLSENFKLGFVSGYSQAMVNVRDIEGFECLAERNGGKLPSKPPSDQEIDACLETPRLSRYDFGKLRMGQLQEGVDEFYKDFRNKGVEIDLAMDYVRDELKGKPAKELEEELARIRH